MQNHELGFSQVIDFAREGVLLEVRNTPSPEKSTTWRCRAKTVIFLPLPPRGEEELGNLSIPYTGFPDPA
jgi:hypothetical protein